MPESIILKTIGKGSRPLQVDNAIYDFVEEIVKACREQKLLGIKIEEPSEQTKFTRQITFAIKEKAK